MSVDKSSVLKKLRESDAIYVLMSDCTRMPFVVCDPETYDDEVFIFFSEEDAMRGGQEFLKANNPLKIFNIEKKYLLPFYSSLFPIGVNCMVIGKGTEEEIAIQLGELVRRPEQKPGEEPIENPELQITAMYFMQKVRSQKELKLTDETKELQEELMAHYQRGRYITAISEDKKMPILNKDDGQVLMPIFTDVPSSSPSSPRSLSHFAGLRSDYSIQVLLPHSVTADFCIRAPHPPEYQSMYFLYHNLSEAAVSVIHTQDSDDYEIVIS